MSQPLRQPGPNRKPLRDYLKAAKPTDNEIRAILKNAADEAERLIPKLIEQNTTGGKIKAAQIRIILREVRTQQSAMWGDLGKTIRYGMQTVAVAAATEAEDTLMDYLRNNGQDTSMFRIAFAEQARRGMRHVFAKSANGIPLSTQVYRTQALSMGWVHNVVNSGLILQHSAKRIAQNVRHLINPNVPGGVSYAAFRLARTELNNSFKTAQEQRYVDEPWTKGMRWNLSGSHPTPDECNEYAEANEYRLGPGIYPVGLRPHSHPNCLCYLTPEQDDEEDFINAFVNGDYDYYLDDTVGSEATSQIQQLRRPSTPQETEVRRMKRDGASAYTIIQFLRNQFGMTRDAARKLVKETK